MVGLGRGFDLTATRMKKVLGSCICRAVGAIITPPHPNYKRLGTGQTPNKCILIGCGLAHPPVAIGNVGGTRVNKHSDLQSLGLYPQPWSFGVGSHGPLLGPSLGPNNSISTCWDQGWGPTLRDRNVGTPLCQKIRFRIVVVHSRFRQAWADQFQHRVLVFRLWPNGAVPNCWAQAAVPTSVFRIVWP